MSVTVETAEACVAAFVRQCEWLVACQRALTAYRTARRHGSRSRLVMEWRGTLYDEGGLIVQIRAIVEHLREQMERYPDLALLLGAVSGPSMEPLRRVVWTEAQREAERERARGAGERSRRARAGAPAPLGAARTPAGGLVARTLGRL